MHSSNNFKLKHRSQQRNYKTDSIWLTSFSSDLCDLLAVSIVAIVSGCSVGLGAVCVILGTIVIGWSSSLSKSSDCSSSIGVNISTWIGVSSFFTHLYLREEFIKLNYCYQLILHNLFIAGAIKLKIAETAKNPAAIKNGIE